MKKILLIISIISVLFLTGCNTNLNMNSDVIKNNENQSQEGVQNIKNTSKVEGDNENVKSDGVNEDKATISFKYTDLESLENRFLLPAQPTIGKLYDIGNVKIGNNIYEVKYVVTAFEYLEPETKIGIEKNLKFYDGDVEKLELVIYTENWERSYTKEISLFKGKYLVTVSSDDLGTLQSLEIYDENLKKVKVKYNGDYEYYSLKKDGTETMYVNTRYENYYSVNEDDVTFIFTDYNEYINDSEKLTCSVSEVNGELEVKIIDKTTEGVLGYVGKTF